VVAAVNDQIVYLNGVWTPLAEARVPVQDRGFLFGDGVYEVIPVYTRTPLRLPEHLARLQRSLDALRIANPHSAGVWTALVGDLIDRHPWPDQCLYLQVTRGVAKRDHAFPKDATPTVFLMSSALATPSRDEIEGGVAAVSATDFRWGRCDIKSIALLGNVLLRQVAVDAGAAETVLFRDGLLTEGAASNIFVVLGDLLVAPPKSHLILPGITYDLVLELAAASSAPHCVREITEQETLNASELWLTSSTKEVLAITRLNGRPVGDGKPGPVFRRMHALYQEFKAAHCSHGVPTLAAAGIRA
jgi:D-alanine transaminase